MSDINTFKKIVSALESSNNPNAIHPVITKGPNKGQSAVGQYGIVPGTAQEFANRAIKDQSDVPSDRAISSGTPDQVKEMLENNPELMQLYTDRLSKHVMDKSHNNPEQAYMRWVYGHNLDDSSMPGVNARDPATLQKIKNVIESQHLYSEPNPFEVPDTYIDKPYSPIKKK